MRSDPPLRVSMFSTKSRPWCTICAPWTLLGGRQYYVDALHASHVRVARYQRGRTDSKRGSDHGGSSTIARSVLSRVV